MAVIKSNTITFLDNASTQTYIYVRYSNDGKTFTENNGTTPGPWLGICSSNSTTAPSNFDAYTWSYVHGVDGTTLYTWIKYADDVNGTNMSDDPTNKPYIGIAYNKEGSVESEDPADYHWSAVHGNGISRIEEYYLKSDKNTGITKNNENWSTDIPILDPTYKYLWNKEITYFTNGNSSETEPIVIGVHGDMGSSLQVKYIISESVPVINNNDVSGWVDQVPAATGQQKVYMTQKLSTETNWSVPIQISAIDGENPNVDIIGGYWYVNGESTGIKAEGVDGETPKITIGANGNWYINNQDSGTKAQGAAGKDGSSIEYVYYRSQIELSALSAPSYNGNILSDGWTASPQGITVDYPYEYVSVRTKAAGTNTSWSQFSKPVIWSKWGEKGQDGDGVEYKYYLSNSNKAPTYDQSDSNWKDDPQGITNTKQYEYVVQIKLIDGVPVISEPALWAKYGNTGSSLQVKYISSATFPTINNNDVSKWTNEIPTVSNGQIIYMTQKLSTDVNWSTPIQISAVDGETPNITISGGYWCVNGESTGVKAEGADGHTPTITVGSNGNWYIDGMDSKTKAQGEAGKDGASVEYVYYLSDKAVTLSAPSYNGNVLTTGWSTSPKGITETDKYEYVSVRTKSIGGNWSSFSTPTIWSKWGEKGQDGDGIEYKYYLSNSSTAPTYSTGASGWTDEPTGVYKDKQYEYVIQIKKVDGKPIPADKASLWAKFGKEISNIENYYTTTKKIDETPSFPGTPGDIPPLNSENKFLWNYEKIIYTEGSPTTTTPAIIGVYGDKGTPGADAIMFKIYSPNGFEFIDDINKENKIENIELNVAAFKGGNALTGATYRWFYLNADGENDIEGAINSILTVNVNDEYAFSNLGCAMTYGGTVYYDYITLRKKVDVYTASIKFFNGTNVFSQGTDYLIGYVELYKNGKLEEGPQTSEYYDGLVSIDANGYIVQSNTAAISEAAENDLCYYIVNNQGEYDVILGQYINGKWKRIEHLTNYIYHNNTDAIITSNLFVVQKNKVLRSTNIHFSIYSKYIENSTAEIDTDSLVASTQVTIIDLNDTVISDTPPLNRYDGQLWLDTGNNILKVFKVDLENENGGNWELCSEQQKGQSVYAIQPESYKKGDLWIVEDGNVVESYAKVSGVTEVTTEDEYYVRNVVDNIVSYTKATAGTYNNTVLYVKYSYVSGSMLRAIVTSNEYNQLHWEDAMSDTTETISNIAHYMNFDSKTGLKIGQTDDKFYVNISSTRMSFCSTDENAVITEEDIDPNEVVYISGHSAHITNLNVETNANFNCTSTFNNDIIMGGFKFQLEANGSLSLVLNN